MQTETADRVVAVERAIRAMRADLGSDLTLAELARSAHYSRFHFSRVFAEVTGTTPGRFRTALRLHEAQRRLREEDAGVADVGTGVGFASVGTFGTRFRQRVGSTPSAYRAAAGRTPWPTDTRRAGRARGQALRIQVAGAGGPALVGLFDGPTMTGLPLRWSLIEDDGDLAWDDMPPGARYVLARPLADTAGELGGRSGPVGAGDGALVRIQPLRVVDPPWLTALPGDGLAVRPAA